MKPTDLLRLLFPPKCMFCGALLPKDAEEICPSCRNEILLSAVSHQTQSGAFLSKVVTALTYEDKVRKAVQRFKFQGRQSFARPLARILYYAVEKKLMRPYDLVTFVPTNARNLRRRGYNHAELLAREFSCFADAPCAETLRKARRTKPMYGLKPAERRANALGAFTRCCPEELIRGKTILLVDDVFTTGATMSECARILREGGADCVFGAAAAAPPVRK